MMEQQKKLERERNERAMRLETGVETDNEDVTESEADSSDAEIDKKVMAAFGGVQKPIAVPKTKYTRAVSSDSSHSSSESIDRVGSLHSMPMKKAKRGVNCPMLDKPRVTSTGYVGSKEFLLLKQKLLNQKQNGELERDWASEAKAAKVQKFQLKQDKRKKEK